jgi:hypothetical protein
LPHLFHQFWRREVGDHTGEAVPGVGWSALELSVKEASERRPRLSPS